jgi:hypothetical protein
MPFPTGFVRAMHSLMKRSTPTRRASPAIGRSATTGTVAASVITSPPITPLVPFEVSMAMPRMVSCCPRLSGTFMA